MRILTIIFIFYSFISFGQGYAEIEIRLVNSDVGHAVQYEPDTILNYSNDIGLNSIFEKYNVYSYQFGGGHPYPPYQLTIGFISFNNSNGVSNQFISDLKNYSSVVADAKITSEYNYTDVLNIAPINKAIGIPIGLENDIVITNDVGLNEIFKTFNVFYFDLSLLAFNIYTVVCDCNASELKVELDNYNSVIESSYLQNAAFLLSTKDYQVEGLQIFPNPVSDFLYLNFHKNDSKLSVFDLTGKCLININDLKNNKINTANLSSGLYILQIEDSSGIRFTKKFVKN